MKAIDSEAIKQRAKEKHLTVRQLSDRVGYSDVRSLFRALEKGKADEWHAALIDSVLFPEKGCPICGADMRGSQK